jgi:hypothetical protein
VTDFCRNHVTRAKFEQINYTLEYLKLLEYHLLEEGVPIELKFLCNILKQSYLHAQGTLSDSAEIGAGLSDRFAQLSAQRSREIVIRNSNADQICVRIQVGREMWSPRENQGDRTGKK